MPGKSTEHEIELIIEHLDRDRTGSGGGHPPTRDGGDDGDSGNRRREPEQPPYQRRYYTAIIVAMVAILIFFMALASAYIVRRGASSDWVGIHIPPILWLNTFVLLLSSGTLELARRRLAHGDAGGFRKLWMFTTILGVGFLAGQYAAWRLLQAQGVFMATNPASSFFYIFTGAHAVHLFGGVAALFFVAAYRFERSRLPRAVAAEVASYYWHFMDALWVFLLALIYVGK